jgi:DNA polymerase (family X)
MAGVNNKEIARIFEDIGALLELKNENAFKVRAYQKVARSIEQLPIELALLRSEGRIREVPGVGEAIEKKIVELLETGRLEFYENLKSDFPRGVSTLLDVPGIGPKTAMLLAGHLNVESVADLEQAIVDGRVAKLPRMGEKTAGNILRHLRELHTKDRRILLGEATRVLDGIMAALAVLPGLKNLGPAGSLRRFCETIGDIDIMGTADDPEAIVEAFVSLPGTRLVLAKGSTKASVLVSSGLQVDLRIVEHEAFGSLLQHFTGSKQHNVKLRERARRLGLSLSEYGITEIDTGRLEKFQTEEAFYQRQGLQYIPPELREGTDEIDRAEAGTIPHLVEEGDIRGDLHVHSDWTDGRESLEDMVRGARDRGYEYVCISDHSAGRGIARGLSRERLEDQMKEIARLRDTVKGIEILAGMEVDIRGDGTLDMPDEVLEKLDFVTGSIHSGMEQSREQTTARILKAMDNPNMDMLGHPTGRLMPRREPVDVDIEVVFQAARKTGTILEINSMPDRLDLKDTHVQRARQLGVMMAINTDSHSSQQYRLMRFGVGVARRGWCGPSDIINTRNLSGLMACVKPRTGSARS